MLLPADPAYIDAAKASMILFDTFGIEAKVTENNPKYANSIIKQLKAFKKVKGSDDSYAPYKAAYGTMPPQTLPFSRCTSMGIVCYVYKFGMVTNGLGIVRDITFYNKEFLAAHPDIVVRRNWIPLTNTRALPIPKL